jgi:glutamate synthase domain-containing protein 3
MVDLEPLIDADDVDFVRVAIVKHVTLTGSRYAEALLSDMAMLRRQIVKVMPREYKRAIAEQAARLTREAETEVTTTIELTGIAAGVATEQQAGTAVHG